MTLPSEFPTRSVMLKENGHRPSHRRGRSLSDTLTLEQSDDGALVVSSINNSTSANQGLRRGDEILGATINFDQLSKEEVLQVLKLMEPFDDKIQVVTKNNRSKSIGNLDQYTKTPETMLKDSYSKLYNAKIKKFMRNDGLGEETSVERDVTATPTVPASSRVNLNHGMELPRLGVDFGLKTKTLSKDVNSDSQFDDTGEMTYGTNLNLPPLSLGSNGAQVPRLKVNARSPQLNPSNFQLSAKLPEDPNVNTAADVQVPRTDSPSGDLSMTNLDRPQTGLNINGNVSAPEVGLDLKGTHVSTPDMGINLNGENITGPSFDMGVPKVATEGTNKEFKMPKFKLPNIGLSGSSFSGPEYEVETPDIDTPDIPSGKLNVQFSKRLKKPDLNVDDPSSYAESPQVRLSGKSPNLDLEMPDIDVPQHDLNGSDIDMPSGEVEVQLKNSKMDLKSPDLDVDAPSGKLTWPKLVVSGRSEAHVKTPDPSLKKRKIKRDVCVPDINLPKANLKEPNLAIDTTLVDNKGQSGKYKAPKFTMPKFDLPYIQDLGFNGDLVGPHMQLAAPDLKPGIADQNFNLNVTSTDLDIASQSGKLTMPSLGQSGPEVKSTDYELKNTGMDVPPSKFKGGISLPGVDLKEPTLDLNTQDININMPSGKLDTHRDGPSSKLKLQKFKLFGTLPKKKHVYIGEGMKTPELTLKSPKKDGMDAPDLSVPNVDLKASKLDLHTPDVNMDSHKGKFTLPKLKLPSFGLSSPKGVNTDVNASLNRLDLPSGGLDIDLSKPEFDIDSPSLDLKGPMSKLKIPDADIGSPSGKIKMPSLTMPYNGLSGPKQKGLGGELKTPIFKGSIGSPDLSLPEMDLNKPRLDLSGTDTPDMYVEAPSSKFQMSQFNLSGTLPKGPNLDLNSDLKSPDLNLKTPKIKGGIDPPDLNLPEMDLKAPKLDVNAPNVNIGSPKSKLKMPKLKMPNFGLPSLKGPEMSGSFDGPDMNFNAPNVNFKGSKADLEIPNANIAGPLGKFKMPNLNLPDLELSGPKLDGPNLDLKSRGLDISGPNLSGGINAPDIDMTKVDFKNPKLDLTTPKCDFEMPSGKGIKPELHAPDWDVNAPSGKLKIPKFNLSGTLPKGPNLDLNSDLKSPDLNLTAPKIKGGIDTPDLNLPKIDLKAPKLDVNAPQMNIGSPKSKLKMPKLKMPKFGLPSLKGPEMSGSFDGPDMNFNAPNVNFKGSKADLEIPNANVAGPLGKFKMPNVYLPDFELSGPKLDGPNLDLKSRGLDISGPNLSGGINAPDIDMTKVDFKNPKLDLTTPKFDLKMPSGKGIKPELHAPDWDVNAPSGKLKTPKFNLSGTLPKGPNLDLNSDFKSPDLNLTAPKIKGGIDTPDLNLPKIDLKAPKLDVNAPQMNIGSPKSKLKMPKFGLPSLKGPEMSGSFDSPDMNFNAPNVNFKGSKADLEIPNANVAGPLGKFKMPNLNLPDLELSGPKLDGPNLDLKSRGLDISGPNLSGGINAPDIDMTKVDFKNPKLDLTTPKFDLKMPSGKGMKPELHAPDWDVNAPSGKLKTPKFNLSGTLPKGPNLDLNSDLKSPDLNLTAPKIKGGIDTPDLNLPKIDLKAPKLDVNAPQMNIGSPKSKLKMPKLKMPKFGFPSLKGPEMSGSFDSPDVNFNAPNVNFKGSKADLEIPNANVAGPLGKFKMPNVYLPDFELSGPKLDGPNLDLKSRGLDISGPNLSGGINAPDIDMTKVDFKNPKLDLTTPKFDLKMPSGKGIKPELHAPDWDVNAPSGKLKTPKFNLSGTLPKGPNLDLNSDLKSPDLNLTAPKIKGGIDTPDLNLPKIDLKAPKLDVNAPQMNIGSPKSKLKMPKLKMPKFGFPSLKGPEISSPNLNGSISAPDLTLTSPKIKGGIDPPDLNLPKIDLKAPKLDVNAPNVNIGSPKAKVKMPKMKMPKFGLPSLKGPSMNGSLDGLDADLNVTNVNWKGPKADLEMPDVGISNPSVTLKKPNFNLPDFGLSGPKLNDPNFPKIDLKSPKLDMNTPDVNIGSRQTQLKMPKVNLPNLKGPEIDGNFDGPEINNNATNFNLKVSKPGFEMPDFGSPNKNLKAPKLDMNSPDVNIGFPEARVKKPKIKMPKGPNFDSNRDLRGPDLNIPNVDGNYQKGELKMPSLNTQDIHLNHSGPKLKSPDESMPDLDLLGTKFRGQPDMNFTAPQVKRGAKGPDFDINVPSGNIQGPQSDLDLVDRTFKLPFFKLPQFGGPDLNRVGSDIDFGAPLRSTNQNISPPNAKLNMKPPQLKGNITGPNVSAPNTNLTMPKAVMPNPQVHFKNPDLNIDDLSQNLKHYKNRRSGSKGVKTKMLALDVDGDVRPHYTDGKSSRTKIRSSYPQDDAHLGYHIDFNRSDLNVDDFTGKDHVLRARGSKGVLQSLHNDEQVISPSGVNIDVTDPRCIRGIPTGDIDIVHAKPQKTMQLVPSASLPHLTENSRKRIPDSTDGYYVTVFPTQAQNPKVSDRKYNTLAGPGLYPTNVDLDVPGENDLKGSTFFFSNLI